MPESADPANHVVPYVHESLSAKALHFSICEVQSRMKLDDPYALDLEYTRTMMGFLLFQPAPRHISMTGHVRRPAGLDRAGAGQLQDAFALVARALRQRQS
jgi:hypothetical protein